MRTEGGPPANRIERHAPGVLYLFRGTDLVDIDREADDSRANLSNAFLDSADLLTADLPDANLRGADLRGADLNGVPSDDRTRWRGGYAPPEPSPKP